MGRVGRVNRSLAVQAIEPGRDYVMDNRTGGWLAVNSKECMVNDRGALRFELNLEGRLLVVPWGAELFCNSPHKG